MSPRRRRLMRVGAFGTATQVLRQSLFSDGEQGWIYPHDSVVDGEQVMFQDAAETVPVVDETDPVRVSRDLSGNDNHALATSDASRPTYPGLLFDGSGDFFEVTMTMTGLYDLMLLFKPGVDTTFLLASGTDSQGVFVAEQGSVSEAITFNSGTPTLRINGADSTATTRGELYNEIDTADVGDYILIEVLDMDVTAWGNILRLSGYSSTSFRLAGDVGAGVFRQQMTTSERAEARNYLAALAGLTL